MSKEFFIKNPARALKSTMTQEPYVPEHQRLMAEGKLTGSPVEGELSAHQAQMRSQIIKEMQMAPKVTVPTVGQRDIGWNNRASFYDEPLNNEPVYDENLIREDLSNEQLDEIYEELAKKDIKSPKENKSSTHHASAQKNEYVPPASLKDLNNNEMIIIVNNQVVFNSLEDSDIKEKLAELIFEKNINPDNVLVIKRLPVSISINIK